MSARRFAVLATHIPESGAIHAIAADGWTVGKELAAATLEQVHAIYRVLLMVHGDDETKRHLPAQLRVPRPTDVEDDGPHVATPAELAAFIGR